MQDYSLGQTLLVAPDVPFARIAAVLANLGWQQEQQPEHPPLVPGEPEFATWSWQGRKPFVVYSCNPVVRLRVLDVATVPPVLRGAIAAQLPLLDGGRVEALLSATDVRETLLGLWAAQETERLDLLSRIECLARGPAEPLVARTAGEVRDRLVKIDEARIETLAQLRVLCEAAPALVRRLTDPAFVGGLKPAEDELAALFDESLDVPLRRAVAAIYVKPPRLSRLELDARIEVFAAPAGLLRWSNPVSDKFPRGYRDIAGWMKPKRIWLAWTISTPWGGTVRYDGLVWLDGRWIWLPKIYRYLAAYLLPSPEQFERSH